MTRPVEFSDSTGCLRSGQSGGCEKLPEGTVAPFKAEDIRNRQMGEYHGKSMINDFNDGAVGWTPNPHTVFQYRTL